MNELYNINDRFEIQKECKVAPIVGGTTHGKEYQFSMRWSGDGQKILNYKMAYSEGKLYYIEHGYVFESKEDATEQRVLIKIGKYFPRDKEASIYASNVFLAVNCTGIYLYKHTTQLTVIRFTLEGEYVSRTIFKGYISQVYINDTKIFYARDNAVDNASDKQAVYYADLVNGESIFILEATKVLELYGTFDKMVMKVAYTNVVDEEKIYDEGWYMYSFLTKEIICISSHQHPPHNVWDSPSDYLKNSPYYIVDKKKYNIRVVDLLRDIMWVAHYKKETVENGTLVLEYWEAMELSTEGKILEDIPVWKISAGQFGYGIDAKNINEASYFDGTCFLNGRGLYAMKVYDMYGQFENYGEDNKQGACNKFQVLNQYVYADFNGKGWEQHKIIDGKLEFVRMCWFGLPAGSAPGVRELVMEFNKRK